MNQNSSNPEQTLFLASGSPRRRELLTQIGIPFVWDSPDVDETLLSDTVEAEVVRLSSLKASAAVQSASGYWGILGSDTVVSLGNTILGKPETEEEARQYLELLSGKTHEVVTGVTVIRNRDNYHSDCVVSTEVTFSHLSDREIRFYLSTGEWRGVAGAYRIQGVGAVLVESISGSYSNIVGLPISRIYGMLQALDFPFFGK